jgi:aspartyl-tRNA(Asn)/glutamyl-tRNA(Gln) amidotransferase subunit A
MSFDWTTSPVAATELRLDRIARLNPQLRAFLTIDAAGARQAAWAAERRRAEGRPLSTIDGMPIGIKANIAVQGWDFHAGILAYRHRIATQDATCVAQLRAGGAVLLGLLNMDEAALGDTTDNPHFGRTENPLRAGFTAGGSSGGAAAAVAAGLCEAALGTDTLGSVRIPAAYCGIIGHKPPPGQISTSGVVKLDASLDSVGILAATVAIAGAVRSHLSKGPPAAAEPLRSIGIFPADATDISPAVAEAFAATVEKASTLGLAMHPIPQLEHPLSEIAKAALLVVELQAAATYNDVREHDPAGFSEGFLGMLDWAEAQSPARRLAARSLLANSAAEIRRLFAPYGVVLMPTTPSSAFAFGSRRPRNTAAFTALANIAGLAATAFPVGLHEDMPLSVQAVGTDEASCLYLAGQLAGTNVINLHRSCDKEPQ